MYLAKNLHAAGAQRLILGNNEINERVHSRLNHVQVMEDSLLKNLLDPFLNTLIQTTLQNFFISPTSLTLFRFLKETRNTHNIILLKDHPLPLISVS